ncbi:hypothetical protein TGPRC2_207240 [Toxoplasma gondii TgCatPRC2]|uniref:Ubiquitin-like domain-containing protein n=6 Tax=Toxoplasma gondii TaxID=5811 RepID=A0A151H157_TOXGO|nr:hypothetical protein TGME49_207240 [Toxoplasma gondii ME49]KFG36399.1 hypothetical protein TGDOM2_207240 [Toxoplasma gondii GAB2-2007-GAL-DOM2]KFG57187.1 hypothetical protein TGRUB_207240 [Toxoplasma gondii RUB]KYF42739.1 hypothetical protein TGARI_207240 [Toxoplasma gondii ARI]KYK63065.1 hypothetical protein TGPRC2_207240 [Toxoplasma gondii TgCatPRC2]PIL96137.1 hypothetical protein TGCOUG_207240 [Toxoplasma gondii COUG]|eukprot:XP_002372009.1 hypothetical protein TGME49_207240 [Toxoplasma gondii ME49]
MATDSSSGLSLPPKNAELREKEDAALQGDDLRLIVALADRNPVEIEVKSSTEVGYVKLLLADRLGIEARRLRLFYHNDSKEVTLIDPMSLCDFKGIRPPSAEIQAQIL